MTDKKTKLFRRKRKLNVMNVRRSYDDKEKTIRSTVGGIVDQDSMAKFSLGSHVLVSVVFDRCAQSRKKSKQTRIRKRTPYF